MRIGRWARVLLAAAPLLAGCKGFWDAPSNSGGGGGTGANGGVFYVLNQGTKQIAAYTIASGTLTPVASPYAVPASIPTAIAVAPNGDFLYVATETGGIYLYTIGSVGALTLANGSVAISPDYASTMQVVSSSTNSWLVEAGPNSATLWAIAINPTTGVLISASEKEQSVPLPAATVEQLAVSPDNSNVFVALGGSGTEVVPFTVNSGGNPLGNAASLATPINSGGADLSVAVDPSNRLVYVGETAALSGTNSGGLRVFNYSTLKEISSSPYATGGLSPSSILPTPHSTIPGSYVYVADGTRGNIYAFAFTAVGSAYSLSDLKITVSAGTDPAGLAQDSTGTYVLAVNSGGSPDLDVYTFDSTTAGKLDSALTASTGTDPVVASAIAAVP